MSAQRWSRSARPLMIAAVSFTCIASAVTGALAQSRQRIDDIPPTTYILTTNGAWGGAQDQAIADAGGERSYAHGGSGVGVARSKAPDFLERVMASGAFASGSADQLVQWETPAAVDAVVETGDGLDAVNPDDEPYINAQWNLDAIDVPGAWALGYDGQGVRVAVVDGGICSGHPDLAGRVDDAASRSFVPGIDFYYLDGPGFRRACHLAGVVAANDDATGSVGIAPRATIIVCKALDRGFGSFEWILEALLYAADPVSEGGGGADIILIGPTTLIDPTAQNGTDPLLKAMQNAVKYARDRNVVVVGGAGDEALDLDKPHSKIAIPAEAGAISVGATGPLGFAVGYPDGAHDFKRPAVYSNYGRTALWVAAPGGDNALDPATGFCRLPRVPSGQFNQACPVYDMVVGPGYVTGTTAITTWSAGTAVAAAHVAGVAALLRQKYPDLSPSDIKVQLASTSDPGPTTPELGHGFINAGRALSTPIAGQNLINSPGRVPIAEPGAIDLAIAPQPTRGTTWFTFSLSRPGRVQLEVMDLAGRSVATIWNGAAPAGKTRVAWTARDRDGRPLRPGAYFAKFSDGQSRSARRLVLVP